MEGSGTDSRRIRQNEDMRLPFVPVQRLLTLLKAVLHIFHFFFIDHKLYFLSRNGIFHDHFFLAYMNNTFVWEFYLFYNRFVNLAFFTFLLLILYSVTLNISVYHLFITNMPE